MPVIINGVDASYAVVEGDWGLAKGVHCTRSIYGGRYVDPVPNVGHYYPSAGHMPGYGRLEIEPPANRRLPQPAESYHQIMVGAICPTAGAARGAHVSAAGDRRAAGRRCGDAAGFLCAAAKFSASKSAERSSLNPDQ